MRTLILILFFAVLTNPAYAESALSVVGNEASSAVENPVNDNQNALPEKTSKGDTLSPLFDEDNIGSMRKYIETERKKKNDIELLNLDIKKNELELKRKQLQAEIEGVNKTTDQEGIPSHHNNTLGPLDNTTESPIFKVLYVSISGSHKESVLFMNGNTYLVGEGQTINGYKVDSIQKQGVTLKDRQGETIEVSMNFLGK